MSKYLVCSGDKVVELHSHNLSKDEAKHVANSLVARNYKNVRVRMEDPAHPTWPLHFDDEEKA
jgi:hypothetical protein